MPQDPHTFAVGDRVICNPLETPAKFHHTIWTVERLLPVNVVLRPEGGGRGLRIHPSALLSAPDGNAPAESVNVPFLPQLGVGTVVTIASPRWRGSDGLYVVLADTIESLKLVLLGGDNDRVWSRVPRGWATEVDKKALLDAIAGLRRRPA